MQYFDSYRHRRSYLGTRAVTEAIGARGSIGLPEQERDGSLASWINDGVNIIFAGNNFSAAYHLRILREFLGNDVCLCVVSKSGETMETKAAFASSKRRWRQSTAKKKLKNVFMSLRARAALCAGKQKQRDTKYLILAKMWAADIRCLQRRDCFR